MKSFRRAETGNAGVHSVAIQRLAVGVAGLLILGMAGCTPAPAPAPSPSSHIPVDTTPPSPPPTAGSPSDPTEGLGLVAEPNTTDPAKYGAAVAEAVYSYDTTVVTRQALIDYLSEWLVLSPNSLDADDAAIAVNDSVEILTQSVIFPDQLWDEMTAHENVVSGKTTRIVLDDGHEIPSDPEFLTLGIHLVTADVTVNYSTPTDDAGVDEEFRLSMQVRCPVDDPASAKVPEWALSDRCGLIRIFDEARG